MTTGKERDGQNHEGNGRRRHFFLIVRSGTLPNRKLKAEGRWGLTTKGKHSLWINHRIWQAAGSSPMRGDETCESGLVGALMSWFRSAMRKDRSRVPLPPKPELTNMDKEPAGQARAAHGLGRAPGSSFSSHGH